MTSSSQNLTLVLDFEFLLTIRDFASTNCSTVIQMFPLTRPLKKSGLSNYNSVFCRAVEYCKIFNTPTPVFQPGLRSQVSDSIAHTSYTSASENFATLTPTPPTGSQNLAIPTKYLMPPTPASYPTSQPNFKNHCLGLHRLRFRNHQQRL